MIPEFQFHKGTIKTLRCLNTLMSKNYFNSIKVRLKLSATLNTLDEQLTFQFHKGTIKTIKQGRAKNLYEDFNSIKVRLKQTLRF